MKLSSVFLAVAPLLFSALAFAQDVTGLTLGMPLAQAESSLSGYKINTLQGGEPFLTIAYATKERDGYLLEAVNGKLALIDHLTTVPVAQGVDQKTYTDSARQKYGKPSPMYAQYQRGIDQTTPGDLRWAWDGAGHQINEAPCPSGFVGLNVPIQIPRILDPINRPTGLTAPQAVMQLPQSDIPNCHRHLNVLAIRPYDGGPPDSVSRFEVILEDPSMLYPEVAKILARQREKTDADKKALQQRQGPPL